MNQRMSEALHSARAFIQQRIAAPRAAALLICSVLLPLLAGCGHTVRFADLKPIVRVAEVTPLRNAFWHGLKNGLPQHSGDYLVGAADLIEVKAADGSPVLPISDICPKPCAGCAESGQMEAEVHLAEMGRNVRVTAFVLSSISALRIGRKIVCLGPVLGRPWSQLKTTLASMDVVPSILPQATRWAMPGDTVKVAVEYRFGLRQGAGIEPYTFAEMGSSVDGGGRAYVPAFSAVNPEMDVSQLARAKAERIRLAALAPSEVDAAAAAAAALQSQYSALQVVAEQQAQSAARHIVFWLPGRPLAEQPTLDQLERCLKAMSSEQQQLDTAFTGCADLGIDQYRYQPNATHNRHVSYRLTVEHTVTFVLWDGRRHSVRYRAGQTVAEAARAIHHDVLARDISSADQLFATVDAHMAIRANGEVPFYARLAAAPGGILDQVLLLPGDVVYLSRWEPRPPM